MPRKTYSEDHPSTKIAPPKDADFRNWTKDSLEKLRADVEEVMLWKITTEILDLESKARELRKLHGITRQRSFRGKAIS